MFFSSSWKVILPDRIPSAKHLVVPSKWFSWEILTRSVLYGREVTCAKPHGNDAGLQISSVVPPVSCRPSKRALRSAVKVKQFFVKLFHKMLKPNIFWCSCPHCWLNREGFPPEVSAPPTQHIYIIGIGIIDRERGRRGRRENLSKKGFRIFESKLSIKRFQCWCFVQSLKLKFSC